MADLYRECPECSKQRPDASFENGNKVCFHCRASSVGFSYGAGGSDGKKFFHDDTIKAYQAREIAMAAKNGIEAVPAWTKTHYGAASVAGASRQSDALASVYDKAKVEEGTKSEKVADKTV